MKLRNRAGTWYRAGKLQVPPGGTFELSEYEAQELLKKLPWHFEQVGGRDGEERPGASPREASHGVKSPPPASPMGHESAPAPAPKKRGWKGR
jgi:hypothetical protein